MLSLSLVVQVLSSWPVLYAISCPTLSQGPTYPAKVLETLLDHTYLPRYLGMF